MKLEAPSCETCCLSVHGLKKSGSEIELQYSVPDGWDCLGDGFISASVDFNQEYKYSAFHFLGNQLPSAVFLNTAGEETGI